MKNRVTVAVRQGPRPYQEDRYYNTYFANRKWHLMAVMDGHAGARVSDFCADNISKVFPVREKNPEAALRTLVADLNEATRGWSAGSTFSASIVSEDSNTVSVAVLGDSPVVVYTKNGGLNVSPEHNVRTNIPEREAAQKRGGFYSGGYISKLNGTFSLQLSRALGDSALDGIISREPQIYTVKKPLWVLVASDGLFDPSHAETEALMGDIREFAKKKAAADELMKWAEDRHLKDNATALVWHAG